YKNCKSKVRYFPDTESDEESKNKAIQFRKSIDAQRIQNTISEVDDLEEDKIYDSNEDADKDFNDHDYIKEDDMELEEGDVNIGLKIISIQKKEYDMEEVFDFEKFNDDQFNEQSWIDQFLD
ncbi:9846_t:CDS:2, partial [Acaulospora colombiana]